MVFFLLTEVAYLIRNSRLCYKIKVTWEVLSKPSSNTYVVTQNGAIL